ncbi:MAG: toxin-activating lysine-acyltransferase [Hyphomicrobiaceae bacterium]
MAFWSKKKEEAPKPKQFSDLPSAADQLPDPPQAAPPPPPAAAPEQPAAAAPSVASQMAPPPEQPAAAAPAAPVEPTPEQAAAIAEMREKAQKIAGFLKTQPQFQAAPEGQVETLVGLAVPRGQFLLAEAENKETGQQQPVGTVLWAMVSPEVDQRLSTDPEQPMRLEAADWKSGDIPWVVAMAGDQKVMQPMLQRLHANELSGRGIKLRMKDGEGKTRVAVVNAAPPPAQPGA